MLDKAVEAAVKVVESAINDSDTTKRVEYATPDTLQADLRAYIESYYYRAALKLVAPDGMVESLAIRTVTYKTASSLATLAASRRRWSRLALTSRRLPTSRAMQSPPPSWQLS